MQEVMKDGSTGKLIVEDTLEDLLPHIRKSLEDPRVNFVKVFKGTKIEVRTQSKGPAFERRDTYAAEPIKGSPLDHLIEKCEEENEEAQEKKYRKKFAPGSIKSIKPTKVRR